MLTEEIKIPADGRPIEAFTMHKKAKPDRAFLILPGRGYTVNHFLLDFLWRMAAEQGFFAVKAEYRGYTYRHLGQPYDHNHATNDARFVLDYLASLGYEAENTVLCAKSLGTIATCNLVVDHNRRFHKVILLTPVLYVNKNDGVFPAWINFNEEVKQAYLVFGSNDPYCDQATARTTFPTARIDCYEGADHGLHLVGNYAETIEINRQIIEKVKDFVK